MNIAKAITTLAPLMLLASTAQAASTPLEIAKLHGQNLSCMVSYTCSVRVDDDVSRFSLPNTTGEAWLQSRILPTAQGDLYLSGYAVHEYRLSLHAVTALTQGSCVQRLFIPWSAPILSRDLDKDGTPEKALMLTAGSVGTVQPALFYNNSTLEVVFDSPVCGGDGDNTGESSVFFGIATTSGASRAVRAEAVLVDGSRVSLQTRSAK